MQRGNSTHGARKDEALARELEGQLGPGGSNREEWAAPEPPADDDAPGRADPAPADEIDQDEAEMHRLNRDMAVANDWNPADDAQSGRA